MCKEIEQIKRTEVHKETKEARVLVQNQLEPEPMEVETSSKELEKRIEEVV